MRSPLFCPVALCFALACGQAVHAQTAMYGAVSVTDYGYTVNGSGHFSVGSGGIGGAFGGFYDFPIQSRLHAGLDAHVAFGGGSVTGVKGFVSGRFSFVPNHNPLRPYLQIGGGFISAHVPRLTNIVGPQTITSGALDLAAGLDCRLTRSLDWRALELESGAGGGTKASGSASISTGVVYHFGPGHTGRS